MNVKIYYLYSKYDNIPMYVGSTIQELKLRRENHLSDHRGETKIKLWICEQKKNNKGDHIKIKLIEECCAKDRYIKEAFWTNFYQCPLNEKAGAFHSDEHKKKVSKWMTGRKKSAATIEKMKALKLTKAKGVLIDNVSYRSIREAARLTKISAGLICSVLSGKRNSKKYQINGI